MPSLEPDLPEPRPVIINWGWFTKKEAETIENLRDEMSNDLGESELIYFDRMVAEIATLREQLHMFTYEDHMGR